MASNVSASLQHGCMVTSPCPRDSHWAPSGKRCPWGQCRCAEGGLGKGKTIRKLHPGLPGRNSCAQPRGHWQKCWREGPDLLTFLKLRICNSSPATSYTVKSNIQSWGYETVGILLYLSGGWRRKDISVNGQTMALKQQHLDNEQKFSSSKWIWVSSDTTQCVATLG